MAHNVNIGSVNAGDEFYRYKMPALQSKARAQRRRRAARSGARRKGDRAENPSLGGVCF
jgi:hypothetical protein